MKKLVLTLSLLAIAACTESRQLAIPTYETIFEGTINVRPSEDPTVLPEVTLTPADVTEIEPTPAEPVSSNVNERDKACLAEAIYFEAKGTGRQGMRAVGEVVLNRRDDSRFPNTVCGVVDQRYNGSCQFSYRCDGRPEIYANGAQKALADEIAHELLANRGSDITNGALYFHASYAAPGWFGTLSPRGQFGGNLFYR